MIPSAPGARVVIAGAGPVGLTAALALHAVGLFPLVMDARAAGAGADDPRAVALSHGSRLILERLGAWRAIAATPIRAIHISQDRGFGRARIEAADHDIDALGHVARLAGLTATLMRLAIERGIEVRHDAEVGECAVDSDGVRVSSQGRMHACALLVRAEGSPGSAAAVKDYGQSAIVTEIRSDHANDGRAWERFTGAGPLALLPLEEGFSLVWCMKPDRAAALHSLPDVAFLEALNAATRFAPLRWLQVGPRRVYPLMLARRPTEKGAHEVALGNAAQTLHPVAGQGLNLGLRDAFELAQALRDGVSGNAISAWRKRRGMDRDATVRATDAYVSLFSNDLAPLRAARGIGLALVDALPPLRRLVARRMMFGVR